jgi:HK97 family phage major capsid protein
VSSVVNQLLKGFLAARQQAKRFHAELLGKGVDPDRSFGHFLGLVAARDERSLEKCYGSCRTKSALSASAGGVSGGYTVPEELRHDLMKDVSEMSLFRPRALVVPMSSATVRLPLPDAETAQAAGVPPFFGGIALRWLAEAQARGEVAEPRFRQVELKAHDLTGYALAGNTLLADGGQALDALLRRLFARSLAWFEDYAFLTGDGVGKPLGVTKAPAAVAVTRQAGGQFTQADVPQLAGKLLPGGWETAIWAVSPTALASLGAGYSPGLAWQVNQPAAPGASRFALQGVPGFVTEKLPAVGVAADVVLFDPGLYVIGDRGALEIEATQHEPTAFFKNQSAWRITSRVDGRPALGNPVTLPDTTSTVSPYVYLN